MTNITSIDSITIILSITIIANTKVVIAIRQGELFSNKITTQDLSD